MDYITKTHFPHHRLAAYGQALQVLILAQGLCEQVPRGFAKFANQLLRAAGSAVFNTGEGANARMPGEKRNAFGIARKETGEAAAAAEALARMKLVRLDDAVQLVHAADRLAGLLTGLIKRWERSAP